MKEFQPGTKVRTTELVGLGEVWSIVEMSRDGQSALCRLQMAKAIFPISTLTEVKNRNNDALIALMTARNLVTHRPARELVDGAIVSHIDSVAGVNLTDQVKSGLLDLEAIAIERLIEIVDELERDNDQLIVLIGQSIELDRKLIEIETSDASLFEKAIALRETRELLERVEAQIVSLEAKQSSFDYSY